MAPVTPLEMEKDMQSIMTILESVIKDKYQFTVILAREEHVVTDRRNFSSWPELKDTLKSIIDAIESGQIGEPGTVKIHEEGNNEFCEN